MAGSRNQGKGARRRSRLHRRRVLEAGLARVSTPSSRTFSFAPIFGIRWAMKLASWNINSVRARLDRVLQWVQTNAPDVLCLQETKVEDKDFPSEAFSALGYQIEHYGQRSYNGVALLSRLPLTQVGRGFGDDDAAARFIVANVAGLRVASVYVPNGQSVGSDKFVYKLGWLSRCRQWLDQHADPAAPMALCGDYNIAPEDRDVHDPAAWKGQVLCHPDERAALAHIQAWGVEDVFRRHHPEPGLYSWWDYRMLGFPKNRGLRIDYMLCTPSLAAVCKDIRIDREARKGKLPSDHAPVVAEFSL